MNLQMCTHLWNLSESERRSGGFGQLNDFWRDKRLSKRLKLMVYSCYVVSILPAWVSERGSSTRRRIHCKKPRHFNTGMLLRIENADQTAEDYVKKVKAAHYEPAFDLVGTLRARRLRWLGHAMRGGP